MSRQEAFVWNLVIIYRQLLTKYFPEYKLPRIGDGDPRKKEVFKYFWKLVNDTKDKLRPDEYRLYIQAQLSILKNVKRSDGEMPYIAPNRMVGDRAWARWCVWKKYFDNTKVVLDPEKPKMDFTREAMASLSETHYALILRLGDVSKEALTTALKSKMLFRMAMLKVVSPYFMVMSPIVTAYAEQNGIDMKSFGIDRDLYYSRINDEVRSFYKRLFKEV